MTRYSFVALCLLGLVASSSALNEGPSRMLQRRTPHPAPGQVGSIDFHYAGMIKRQATPAKVAIGTSNAAESVQNENTLSDDTASSSDAAGDIVAFGQKVKRQTGAAAVVVVGNANPAPSAQDLNQLDELTPVSGSNDGNIKTFQAGGVREVRRSLDLNLVSHEIAARGLADGSIVAL